MLVLHQRDPFDSRLRSGCGLLEWDPRVGSIVWVYWVAVWYGLLGRRIDGYLLAHIARTPSEGSISWAIEEWVWSTGVGSTARVYRMGLSSGSMVWATMEEDGRIFVPIFIPTKSHHSSSLVSVTYD